MARIHRTPQDVYALVLPQSEQEYEPGDEIMLKITSRVDRLEEHGWIENVHERDHSILAELTYTGAAILNYWFTEDGDVALHEGVDTFVDEALDNAASDEDVEEWEVVEMQGDHLMLVGETPSGVRIERRYSLQSQSEEHPMTNH